MAQSIIADLAEGFELDSFTLNSISCASCNFK
jgi:hypothetical protein